MNITAVYIYQITNDLKNIKRYPNRKRQLQRKRLYGNRYFLKQQSNILCKKIKIFEKE